MGRYDAPDVEASAMRGAALVALSVGLVAGCAPLWGRRPAAFVPIVERAFSQRAADLAPAPAPPGHDDGTARLAAIDLVARFVRVPVAGLAELPLDTDRPATVLSDEQLRQCIERLGAMADVAVVQAPRLRVLSTRAASFQTLTSFQYVAGYEPPPGQPMGSPPTQPIVREAHEGLVLDVVALADGKAVTLSRFAARWVRLEAICANRATMEAGGKTLELPFQEPLALTARAALPEPCALRLEAGQALAAPLSERALVVERSNVRALVRDGRAEMTRDGTARRLRRATEQGYPLGRDVVILAIVTARVAPR